MLTGSSPYYGEEGISQGQDRLFYLQVSAPHLYYLPWAPLIPATCTFLGMGEITRRGRYLHLERFD